MSNRTATALLYLVAGAWVGTIIATIANFNGYEQPESINGIFALIVGGAFVARRNKQDDGDE